MSVRGSPAEFFVFFSWGYKHKQRSAFILVAAMIKTNRDYVLKRMIPHARGKNGRILKRFSKLECVVKEWPKATMNQHMGRLGKVLLRLIFVKLIGFLDHFFLDVHFPRCTYPLLASSQH